MWELPSIDEGVDALEEIIVEPDEALNPYITFDPVSRAINFRKDERSKSLSNRFFTINISLVNVKGDSNEYSMYVILFESDETTSEANERAGETSLTEDDVTAAPGENAVGLEEDEDRKKDETAST